MGLMDSLKVMFLDNKAAVPETRPGRNEPCHCGSGLKYKKCCSGKDDALLAKTRSMNCGKT